MKIRPMSTPPETAADSAAGGQVVHLVQLHLAVLFFFNNHGVLKGNQIRLLHFQELKAHFLGLEFRIVCHSNQLYAWKNLLIRFVPCAKVPRTPGNRHYISL